ncbi:DUF503 domain-containing protein [Limisalsivibrio acetivorans]|uniref:DUF503 domain-containing protein n=1 Tax=Limisalsivibrio acetivorans TaxID=1304888 RepID=UPI0003B5B57C|nr:DUF503 domain-containing protein [Limisalsivibrio acetivorans]
MVIGSVVFILGVEQAFSLKDKRKIISGLKRKISNRFNVAVSEVGSADLWNRAEIGIVTLSSKRNHVERQLSKVMDFVESYPEVEVMGISEEIF